MLCCSTYISIYFKRLINQIFAGEDDFGSPFLQGSDFNSFEIVLSVASTCRSKNLTAYKSSVGKVWYSVELRVHVGYD